MTRKDFELIASTVLALDARLFDAQQKQVIAADFACKLSHTNPRFDRERFIRAATEGK